MVVDLYEIRMEKKQRRSLDLFLPVAGRFEHGLNDLITVFSLSACICVYFFLDKLCFLLYNQYINYLPITNNRSPITVRLRLRRAFRPEAQYRGAQSSRSPKTDNRPPITAYCLLLTAYFFYSLPWR